MINCGVASREPWSYDGFDQGLRCSAGEEAHDRHDRLFDRVVIVEDAKSTLDRVTAAAQQAGFRQRSEADSWARGVLLRRIFPRDRAE